MLLVIYNPWFSLTQWIYPAPNLDAAAYETGWLFKIITALVAVGIFLFFANVTRKAMGGFWTIFVLVVLGLTAVIPFYFSWLTVNVYNVGYVVYFGVLPSLLGFGLSFGYINRWVAGTLQTTSIGGHAHVADQSATSVHHVAADTSVHHS